MSLLIRAAAFAAVAVAAAAPAAAAHTSAVRGFHVHAAYLATPGPGSCANCLHVTGTGSAWGTHIGAGAWSDSEDATLGPDGIAIVGELTLTAVNGDEIVVDYHVASALPDATGEIHPKGVFVVVGGTGRFAGATGEGILAANANALDPSQTATASLDGFIDY